MTKMKSESVDNGWRVRLGRAYISFEDTGTRRDTPSLTGTESQGKIGHYLVHWTQQIRIDFLSVAVASVIFFNDQ